MPAEKECKVLSPTGILGYGFPEESFMRGMRRGPDVIAVDAGSTDPGPYYLGSGKMFVGGENLRRDLEIILREGCAAGVPVIIGSAGGAGSGVQVDRVITLVEKIAAKNRLKFRLGVIRADVERKIVLRALKEGRVEPLSSVPSLTDGDVLGSSSIVAQMGLEPVLEAMGRNCGVILCGRCYDPVPFAAVPVSRGFRKGLSYHMAKILECAAIAAVPGSGRDCVMGTVKKNYFLLESLNPGRRFTVPSTAAHTLYEKSSPYFLPGPGGVLDLTGTRFEQLGRGTVKVSGSRFASSAKYRVKLEGAKPEGFRTIAVAGIRDPLLIEKIRDVVEEVRTAAGEQFHDIKDRFKLLFRLYGKDAVMGAREPEPERIPHELGLVIESLGDNRRISEAVCSFARTTLLHYGYPGRISTAGNLAFPYSPSDIYCGRVYSFSIYHLLEVDDPLQLFPVSVRDI